MAAWLGVAMILMAAAGTALLFVGSVPLTRWWEVRRPLPVLAGLALLLPWPLCEGLAALANQTAVNFLRIEMMLTGGCLVVALGFLAIGLRRRFEESVLADPTPPLAPVSESPSAIFVPLETLSHRTLLPSKVKCYPGRADLVPPEVEALGRPKHVHAPQRSLNRQRPRMLACLGLLLLGAAGTLGWAFPLQTAALAGAVLAGLIGLGFLLAALFPLPPTPTYLLYRDALLVVLKNDFIVVPWKVVKKVDPAKGLVTHEGERIALNPGVRRWPQLVERVCQYAAAGQLARAQEQVAAGQTAVFGPFAVNTAHLSCDGSTVPWDDVAEVTVQPTPPPAMVEIHTQNSLWCRRPLDFPNEALFVELVKHLCRPAAVATQV